LGSSSELLLHRSPCFRRLMQRLVVNAVSAVSKLARLQQQLLMMFRSWQPGEHQRMRQPGPSVGMCRGRIHSVTRHTPAGATPAAVTRCSSTPASYRRPPRSSRRQPATHPAALQMPWIRCRHRRRSSSSSSSSRDAAARTCRPWSPQARRWSLRSLRATRSRSGAPLLCRCDILPRETGLVPASQGSKCGRQPTAVASSLACRLPRRA
jgi:hypothetical protein